MELGKGVKVNLDKYFEALGMLTDSSDVASMKRLLADYGIKGKVTAYLGEEGDGEILFTYTIDGIKGVLRFSNDGKFHEGWRGWNEVGSVASELGGYFIYGLFGSDEDCGDVDRLAKNALDSGRACWAGGGKCDMDGFKDKIYTKNNADEEQRKAEEERSRKLSERNCSSDTKESVCNDGAKMSVKREVCKNGFGEIISDSTTGQACEEYEAEQAKIKAKEKEAAEKQAREEEREEKRNKSCKEAFGSFYYWDGEMCVRNEVEWERWRDKQNDRWDSR